MDYIAHEAANQELRGEAQMLEGTPTSVTTPGGRGTIL